MIITEEETKQAILHLKSNKAPGPDGISGDVYKVLNGLFLSCITTLFNLILHSGTYPKIWSVGVITPI